MAGAGVGERNMGGWKTALVLGAPIAIASFAPVGALRASTSIDARCTGSQGGFKPAEGGDWYEISLRNICARKLSCTVETSVTDAKGAHKGKGTLALAPGSPDKPATAVYRLEVGAGGGMAEIDYHCKAS
jgi:hypothetical protein